jgi:hypothetical protein
MTKEKKRNLRKLLKEIENTITTIEELDELEFNLSDLHNALAAREMIQDHGTIKLSYDHGIDCEDELLLMGVDTCFVKQCLKQIDYYSCSIKYDGEYHLGKDLDKKDKKLRKHLDKFEFEYEIN